ncbi:hypothetical protein RHGRI_011747 [Rhododendron griersonianum]|uniref:Ubiquitin-like protease family profile domain-containing protein n=1 Tax=Rhododendron griersonianum TaxID=479676 RepID=A0AAV6KNB8_9ERIC|nr:hypothetical protein RHGRI_011747 [Rhododendron griersonianum]
MCLAKDRYIQTLLNKASVLEKQKAKQQDVNNALQMQIDEFKIHEVTQRYADETEGAVHQVTQKPTLEKIRRLERENEELELELLDIRVHEDRQKREAEKSLISPNSNIIALKARERKKNTDADFVYEEVKKKTKIGKELFIDVDDLKSQEDERQKMKLRKLKANAEVAKLLSRESWMAIETLWNTADISTEVWSSKDELMHATAHDIQTLLFESALSTRSIDAYMNILMQQHGDQQPTFILETQPAKSFVFPSFFVRKLIADYINSDSKSSAGKGIENTVHIERCSPKQPDGFVECGVVVISLMKQYLMNQERSKVISIEECRKTRAEMILAFLSYQSKSSTSKVPQPVQKLKQIAESSKALKPQSKQYQLRRLLYEVGCAMDVLPDRTEEMLRCSTHLSSYSMTLLSRFLAVISVNIVIACYICMAMKEPSDKHEPDPAFLASAKASLSQKPNEAEDSSQTRQKEE